MCFGQLLLNRKIIILCLNGNSHRKNRFFDFKISIGLFYWNIFGSFMDRYSHIDISGLYINVGPKILDLKTWARIPGTKNVAN